MQRRHQDRSQYFQEQAYTTRRYVIPFIAQAIPVEGSRVLEIGCGEGGNLVPFLEKGCQVVGVDIACHKIEKARHFLKKYPENQWQLICKDIYDVADAFREQFDIIMMRDVIEHLEDHEGIFRLMKHMLRPGGVIFVAFPPFQMPFGGHQQMCNSRFLSHLPYFHLLPNPLYMALLKFFGEPEFRIKSLLQNKRTGITIERFRKVVHRQGLAILREQLYLINPNYEVKFGLKPRKQFPWITALPYLRNFVTTCGYYLVGHSAHRKSKS